MRNGTLREDVVRAATARQAVYGGALDTAILELAALDEPTLWTALATATGAPVPDAAMFENPDPTAAALFDLAWSHRCRAVPVGQADGVLQLCCSEPLAEAELAAARAALGVSFELFVVPEVRLAAARQAVYGEVMSPRLLRVLARLLGPQPVRKWVKALALDASRPPEPEPAPSAGPAPAAAPAGLVDESELAEAEFDVPVNTYNTQPADIIESRASRAAAEAAADAVARALAGPDTAPPAGAEALANTPIVIRTRTPPPASASVAAIGASTIPADGSATLRGHARVDLAPGAADEPPLRPHMRTPIGRPALELYSDDNESELCAVADDAESEARLAALRVLRARLGRPRVRALADKLQGELKGPTERAILAAGALGELRDGQAVPALIDVLEGPPALARTAARALVEIAQQDFGTSRKKWLGWWEQHRKADRVAWLLEGLSHKSPEIRFASSEELRLITGEYFGYHFDLPKREREEARERWQQWWYQTGQARQGDRS
ncbi:MAG TPA: hypothetical protein VHL80_15175 [Polyangia bacterium]|nr:hypothetical protein [Polyangia bacterium]